MDEITKYRITGAIIWLALLIIIVPSWYSFPVDYQQEQSWSTSVEILPDEALTDAQINHSRSKDSLAHIEPKAEQKAPVKEQVEIIEATTKNIEQKEAVKSSAVTTPKTVVEPAVQIPTENKIQTKQDVQPEQPQTSTEIAPSVEPANQAEKLIGLEERSPAWLIRVASYSSIKTANRTLGQLELRYQVTIGDFSSASNKVYSVRVGPYYSLSEAEKVKQELDVELNTNSAIVQIR